MGGMLRAIAGCGIEQTIRIAAPQWYLIAMCLMICHGIGACTDRHWIAE